MKIPGISSSVLSSVIGVSVMLAASTTSAVALEEMSAGIGIGMKVDEDTGIATVVQLVDRGPAVEGGIEVGDSIVSVDGQVVIGMSSENIVDSIRGPINTPVELTIQRRNQSIEIQLTRSPIVYDRAELFSQQSGQVLTRLRFQLAKYVGDCPSEYNSGGIFKEISFFFPGERPAPHRRVIIENERTGGYTDREYDETRERSQTFRIGIDDVHRGPFLAVLPGSNTLNFRILEGENEIKSGSLSLTVETEKREITRNYSTITKDAFCFGESNFSSEARTSLDFCEGGLITLRELGICPDGSRKIISEETIR